MIIFLLKRLTVVAVLLSIPLAATQAGSCKPVLWPDVDVGQMLGEYPEQSKTLRRQAEKALQQPAAPVDTLRSAGVRDVNDPDLKASRRAFRDADNAAIVALAYAAFDEARYFEYVRDTLLSWAEINTPTGHPIDETRLEGLLWAYDLVCADLSSSEVKTVRRYFSAMRDIKRLWRFGPKTENNNHKTHHLKMLVLLDRVLNDEASLADDTAAARAHLDSNIDDTTGVSIDYIERDALYYHVYNLEAWLEIALLSDCCEPGVDAAFQFTAGKLLGGDIGGEFMDSQADIDQQRAESGFQYAKCGGDFDVERASRAIVSYATLTDEPLDPELWQLVQDPAIERKLSFYFVRQLLWQSI